MTKLSQIIAIEKGVKSRTARAVADLHHRTQREGLLSGIARTYQPRDEEGDQLPSEGTKVQVKADEALREVATALTRLFDVVATKDWSNCEANASVVVDGEALLWDVPVTYLLFLEKELADLHTFVAKLPVLDPAETWAFDPAADVYATPVVRTVRSRKVPKVLVKYEATDKHPAQTEVYQVDEPVGEWSTVKFSGALPAQRHKELLARVVKLTEAVKVAREAANQIDVINHDIGQAVFAYLFR